MRQNFLFMTEVIFNEILLDKRNFILEIFPKSFFIKKKKIFIEINLLEITEENLFFFKRHLYFGLLSRSSYDQILFRSLMALNQFHSVYQCYSTAFLPDGERSEVENGGKILLPEAVLEQLIEQVNKILSFMFFLIDDYFY